MAKRKRNGPKKVIIEFTMEGDLEGASDILDDMLDAGTIQDAFAETRDDLYEGDDVPVIKEAKVFIEY